LLTRILRHSVSKNQAKSNLKRVVINNDWRISATFRKKIALVFQSLLIRKQMSDFKQRKVMSKNKNKNKIKQLGNVGLRMSNPADNQITANEPINDFSSDTNSQSVKSSVISKWSANLKSHAFLAAIIGFLTLGVLGAGLKYLDDDAKREIARRTNQVNLNDRGEETFLNKINPFLPPPTPTPTPQLSKEYVYAGSRMLAIEDAGAHAAPPADLAVWRPSTGVWYVLGGTGSQQFATTWGQSGDIPAPGDYDGDGKTDLAIFRPSTGYWWILRSSDGSYFSAPLGSSGDKVVQADYDGDGKTDFAVFRPSNSTWYIYQTSTGNTVYEQFGYSTDTPTPADFDGDGRADIAVWRNSNTTFYSINSSNLQNQSTSFGSTGDNPVPADYDGDGKADVAVWRSSNATWYIKQSSDSQSVNYPLGVSTDTTVQNDYDGDGKVDVAVWRGVESSSGAGDVGKWYIRQSASPSPTRVETWGTTNDIPVPTYYRR